MCGNQTGRDQTARHQGWSTDHVSAGKDLAVSFRESKGPRIRQCPAEKQSDHLRGSAGERHPNLTVDAFVSTTLVHSGVDAGSSS